MNKLKKIEKLLQGEEYIVVTNEATMLSGNVVDLLTLIDFAVKGLKDEGIDKEIIKESINFALMSREDMISTLKSELVDLTTKLGESKDE